MAKAPKYVYSFGKGKAEGKSTQRELLGGKGAGLAEMTRIGLPVPAGFTITTDSCELFYKAGRKWPSGLDKQVRESLKRLEKTCGKKLGDRKDPLLVSVRSGAAKSMPGMMETILNLGLNDRAVDGLADVSGSRRFALDAYRRFIMMYGTTARGIDRELFDVAFDEIKDKYARPRLGRDEDKKVQDTEVNEEELQALINDYKEIYKAKTSEDFPQQPHDQLIGAITAVFDSWMHDKAVTYRRVENILGLAGTAVNVQQMVFGNLGEDSGTGVCFTRDPSTGENVLYGDWLINAQGEDVVAGVRTPLKLAELESMLPEAYDQLESVRAILESHYKDMQDLEFTIERSTLYMLQCRTGKRSPQAAFKIAVDQATKPLMSKPEVSRLVKKGYLPKAYASIASRPVITREEAIERIMPEDIERLFYPVIDPAVTQSELASNRIAAGIDAVPGAASGKVVFNSARSEALAAEGESVILVRKETSPEDVGGMHAAQGILTATGGKTSHAAVVARGWGKCCIVGCEELNIDYASGRLTVGSATINEGEYITLNGSTGDVFRGQLPLVMPEASNEFGTIMEWCDRARTLGIRTNADTPADARKAIELGAEGIGLCRTEHMFFETEKRRLAMQAMILASTVDQRTNALDRLLPFQRDDFVGLFEAMDTKPVTIRLLDPPLHEFLPHSREDCNKLARELGLDADDIAIRREQLSEANPMLGHRGCRLCVTYPEVLDMQVTAIIEAAVICRRRGIKVLPEIMIPLTIDGEEMKRLSARVHEVAKSILKEAGEKVGYMVGTMIETPRAALLGDRIAESAEFFSFGTNDLTQTTMALSRDDAGRFLPEYVEQGILPADPFQCLDTDGVGMLVQIGIEKGRAARPGMKIGICGEHGGDRSSILFCHQVGMDYVSCSPFRVPVARLAAAQAAILGGRDRVLKMPKARKASAPAKPTRTASKKVTKKPTRKVARKTAPKKTIRKKVAAKAKAGKAAKKKSKKSTRKTARKTPKRKAKKSGRRR